MTDINSTYQSLSKETKQLLDNYKILGPVLRRVSLDIEPFLDSVLDGLLVDAKSESDAVVYFLSRKEGEYFVQPSLQWTDGVVTQLKDATLQSVSFIIPEGKSQGVWLTESGVVLIGLK